MGKRTSATWQLHLYNELIEGKWDMDYAYLKQLAQGKWRPSEEKDMEQQVNYNKQQRYGIRQKNQIKKV